MSLKADVVAHWKRVREDAPGVWERDKEKPCGAQCAFCMKLRCPSCPIMEVTGQSGCIGTPYNEAKQAWVDYKDSGWDDSQRDWWQLKADLMIRFLEGLPDV